MIQMIIMEKLGRLSEFSLQGKKMEWVHLEWFETSKRIMQKITTEGRPVNMKFLKENPNLSKDDVLYLDTDVIIVVDIKPCDVIALYPTSILQTAALCFEIGNKHLPLYFDENVFLTPFDAPLFLLLTKAGYSPSKENRSLLHALKTSVLPHGNGQSRTSLFTKILALTTPSGNDQ
ncbi:MAG: urease accessory protein UreE [Flavisolibacter sp.]